MEFIECEWNTTCTILSSKGWKYAEYATMYVSTLQWVLQKRFFLTTCYEYSFGLDA